MKNFELIFDKIILKQLKKAGKNRFLQNILSKLLDKIEEFGPDAGKLIDSQLHIYEMKLKHPPIRLYYRHKIPNEIYIFEYEMKTSSKKQSKTISKIRSKLRD